MRERRNHSSLRRRDPGFQKPKRKKKERVRKGVPQNTRGGSFGQSPCTSKGGTSGTRRMGASGAVWVPEKGRLLDTGDEHARVVRWPSNHTNVRAFVVNPGKRGGRGMGKSPSKKLGDNPEGGGPVTNGKRGGGNTKKHEKKRGVLGLFAETEDPLSNEGPSKR